MPVIFHHHELLEPETSLVLDEQRGTISLWQAGERVCVQTFTEQEFRLLALFFTRESAIHCTYAEALAAFLQAPIETCQARIEAAREREQFEELHNYYFLTVMKPVITTLKNCQARMHFLECHICALHNYGYVVVNAQHTLSGAQL